jgi:DNA-binding XRE family transcriptional regulator
MDRRGKNMAFKKIDVTQTIIDTLDSDPELKQLWDNSRMEYYVLGELVKLRKEKGLSQVDLAEMTGNKQQVISRIENHENSPTLKTLCSILDVLGYDIKFIPREQM